jgi:hydrogenase nickel incorporation protein HypA/HybF
MHELAISRAILDAAVGHAGGLPVRRVSVTIGALRQVVPSSLDFYFAILARGTLCEEAALETRTAAAQMRCECGAQWELEEVCFRCPRCAGSHVTVLSGEQLCVDSIEVEEVACTAPR